jgi:hypothetical protein
VSRQELLSLAREHRLSLTILVVYLLAGYLLQATLLPGMMAGLWYFPIYRAFLSGGVVSLPIVFVLARWRVRGADGGRIHGIEGWRIAWRSARRDFFTPPRLLRLLFVLLYVPFFLCVFGRWKAVIHLVHPFAWDVRLSALDRWVHLGTYPWEDLQPLLGRPSLTRALDFLYVPCLVGALISTVVWQGWTADRRLRERFLSAFALSWIVLGTIMATALSSAGPCYYGLVTGLPDPYRDLMAYLNRVDAASPLIAVGIQRGLWASYTGQDPTPFSGISAMPSLHVAMPVLFALAGWRFNQWLGAGLAAYAVAMLIGSVHLGWHYAIDGYASILGVVLLWGVAGRAAR